MSEVTLFLLEVVKIGVLLVVLMLLGTTLWGFVVGAVRHRHRKERFEALDEFLKRVEK